MKSLVRQSADDLLAEGPQDRDALIAHMMLQVNSGKVQSKTRSGDWEVGARAAATEVLNTALRSGTWTEDADGRIRHRDAPTHAGPAARGRPKLRKLSDIAPATDPGVTGATVHDGSPPVPDAPQDREHEDPRPVRPVWSVWPVTSGGSDRTGHDPEVLDEVRAWLARFIRPMSERDLDLLTLWTAHTHFAETFYTTPRLIIDSPLPESGKTTTLEHLERLCYAPLQMASLSSPAMLARLLDTGMRTLLIDEVEKNLRADKPGVEDLFAVLNTGYKRGGARPVLVPAKGGGWETKAMPTFSPLAMAGISPDLPEDTMSRTITVLLLPDDTGQIEDSDWEFIEPEALALADLLATWAQSVGDHVNSNSKPELPAGCMGRAKEKWRPLKRVADAAGGRWPATCTELIQRDLDNREHDREEGLMTQRPAIALVRDIIALWPEGVAHWPTDDMRDALAHNYPDRWGPTDRYTKGLTTQRIGRYLGKTWGVRSSRPTERGSRGRGYLHDEIRAVAVRAGVVDNPPEVTGHTDHNGHTGHQTVLGEAVCVACRTRPRSPGAATCSTCRGEAA